MQLQSTFSKGTRNEQARFSIILQTDKQSRINNHYETMRDIDMKTDLSEASQNKLEKETKVTL